MPPSPELLARYAERFNASRTMRFLGVTIDFPAGDRVRATMAEIRPEHRGGLGSEAVNGGVLAAVFDLVIGCTPALLDPTRRSATMQLSMSFLRPVTGDSFRAEAWIDRAGTRTIFASAQILDARGDLCARAQGLSKISKLPWSNKGTPAVN